MRVGDLVRYRNEAYTSKEVGIIIAVGFSRAPYKVRWSGHNDSIRDWYGGEELTVLHRGDLS